MYYLTTYSTYYNYIIISHTSTLDWGLSCTGRASKADPVLASYRVQSGSVSKHTDCTNKLMHCRSAEPAETLLSFYNIYTLHID